MLTIKTTGDLLLGFRLARKSAVDWIQSLEKIRRTAFHLPPERFPLCRPQGPGPVGIFPGSFDPPTTAHVRMARAALDGSPLRSLIITFDLENVDKASHALPLADRIALACIAFRKIPRVGVAIASHGRFIEKARALRRSRSGGGIWFVVGADTMERILQPGFYVDPGREIPELLRSARFAVFPRMGPAARRERGGDDRARTVPLRLSSRLRGLSSTGVRRSLRAGRLPIGDVPDETLFICRERGLYGRSRPPPAGVATSFLMKGGRLLLVKRSQKVGSYRGHWAAVSGHLEWPLSKVRDILGDRLTRADVRRQTLAHAYREIREETGLGKGSLVLLRRGRPRPIPEKERSRDWLIYPFLFRVRPGKGIQLDWEHTEGRWIWPEEMDDFPAVPGLSRTLRALLPPVKRRRRSVPFVHRARLIARDPSGGAMEIFFDALALLEELGEYGPLGEDFFRREIGRVCDAFLSGHPMAPLLNLVDDIWKELPAGGVDLGRRLERLAQRYRKMARRGDEEILRRASRALRGRKRIGTYSYSSTVAAVLSKVARRRGVEVIVVEDRGGHGGRLRGELRRRGVKVRPLAPRLPEDTDVFVVGADAVYGESSFLNARGTGRLAKQAGRLGVPVLVLAHRLKRRPRPPHRLSDPSLEIVKGTGTFI